ncbi:ArsJ-associated glyceraldehyde-3-phosphate dehydrogenase [Aliikangiella coralliicola]|uniref:Glyceraldehyde-3-phosphate dehydrogenase n=1 Tax=Aliikangiella coralliicola TaxID=2592383 RepID=A0A545UI38_9GAMM|nr:ArsJ-associated glyceraldehyde-3-phosphate dehydrogenase [Aliikangiella coralliicola]TQV89134.1 ArsJ-associated glyceraldehyde-3-phosphate dehydrogenase [Aliikangiella coralliicola]
MSLTVAINGFGRMGRLFFRTLWDTPGIEIVHINEPEGTIECSAHLLEFDSVHGKFLPEQITVEDTSILIGNKRVKHTQHDNMSETDWNKVDLLVDCSGKYRKTALFNPVFNQGVKKILVSCPVKDEGTLNIAYGVNHQLYEHEKNHLVTAASCTTNCLAPVIKVLLENFGIEQGAMTTIHDITNTQRIIDSAHKDLRRARSCGESLIPTSSGSTTAIMKIFPELEGKLNGLAVRVPTVNASIVDLVVKTSRTTSVEEVNDAFEKAAKNELNTILGYETRPLVSVDYKDDKRSGIVDALSTQVTQGDMVKVIAWYDNEINYVERMKDITLMIAEKIAE